MSIIRCIYRTVLYQMEEDERTEMQYHFVPFWPSQKVRTLHMDYVSVILTMR